MRLWYSCSGIYLHFKQHVTGETLQQAKNGRDSSCIFLILLQYDQNFSWYKLPVCCCKCINMLWSSPACIKIVWDHVNMTYLARVGKCYMFLFVWLIGRLFLLSFIRSHLYCWVNARFLKGRPIFLYPGYQRFFSRVRRGASFCRPKAEDTSGEKTRGALSNTWPKPETAHEKPLAPRVIFLKIATQVWQFRGQLHKRWR